MKKLTDYTDDEKIKWFDKMYQDAYEQFISLKNTRTTHRDSKVYTWERVIDLLGSDIWIEWNNYDR